MNRRLNPRGTTGASSVQRRASAPASVVAVVVAAAIACLFLPSSPSSSRPVVSGFASPPSRPPATIAAATTIAVEIASAKKEAAVSSLARRRIRDATLQLDSLASVRSIGVDYGLVRTGLAVSTGGYSPRPLDILSVANGTSITNTTQLASAVVGFAAAERVDRIILGLPLHKNGTVSLQSIVTREFGTALAIEARKRYGKAVPVFLWDERYTSKEAHARIQAHAMARNRRIPSRIETDLDADAASILLEHYYAEFGLDAEQIVLDLKTSVRCDEAHAEYLQGLERQRLDHVEEREGRWNARREMMERDRAREGEAGGSAGGKKKKKKKRKNKK